MAEVRSSVGVPAVAAFAGLGAPSPSTPVIVNANNGDLYTLIAGAVVKSSTAGPAAAPAIASGFGTSPSVPSNNGVSAFTVNVGTGGTASSGVITMPAATTGWIANVMNITARAANRANQATVQTGSSTTSLTVQNQTISTGAALAWTASDILRISAVPY